MTLAALGCLWRGHDWVRTELAFDVWTYTCTGCGRTRRGKP